MTAVDLQKLVGILDETCRKALESAAGMALSRTHYTVEIEHWLLKILEVEQSDVRCLLAAAAIPHHDVTTALEAATLRFSSGNGRNPALAPAFVTLLKNAWLRASIDLGSPVLRSGHILIACLSDEITASHLRTLCLPLGRLTADTLLRNFEQDTAGSIESRATPERELSRAETATTGSALDRYTIDLVAEARAGRIDPILGRDQEIRQVIDILCRRRQNNPILTGEAGVGKTAVVEGLALRIVEQDVPDALRSVVIRTLDLGLLQAGAGVKGEFENRLRAVMDDVARSPSPVILFIDEAHTLIGAGGQPGVGDAANLLKPPLARGALRVIAATTWAEYKKYIEKDAALTRRFQTVKVDEPSDAVATDMLRGLTEKLERHHGVRILDEALTAAVTLSRRYIPDRHLPDKAVSLLDTACARVAMSQGAQPGLIESHRRRLSAIAQETTLLAREERSGASHADRLATLRAESARLHEALARDEDRFAQESALVDELTRLRNTAEQADFPLADTRARSRDAAEKLRSVQGEHPLIHPVVDAQIIAEIVENWTGVPARRMRSDELSRLLRLEDDLRARVIGQDHALKAVAEAVRVSRAGLTDPRKPVGVFLMVGTSGVGKTETATALADLLYGGARALTTINMSEFKEEHKVSLLMGSPPGYVGFGEGGVLTEAVRRAPHSVLLLDEFEKAHPGVQEVFFQVFDKGTMKDGEGRDVDFRNTIIIMTTNAGTPVIDALFADPETAPDHTGLATALQDDLHRHFKPAFLGRVTIVPYLPLAEETRRMIVDLQTARLAERVRTVYGIGLTIDARARHNLWALSASPASGARLIERTIALDLLPMLAAHFLGRSQATIPGQATGPDGITISHDGRHFILHPADIPLADTAPQALSALCP